ncbi:MAG: hypothetical protein JWR00_914 [Rubritepida sp.]|nr:hypothetical protein [Rubritepida sp.]
MPPIAFPIQDIAASRRAVTPRTTGLLLLLATTLNWGSTWPLLKLILTGGLPPLTLRASEPARSPCSWSRSRRRWASPSPSPGGSADG